MRNHYLALLTGSGQAVQTRGKLNDYFLDLAGDTPQYPTLEQLAPLNEVVYHVCRTATYDEASRMHQDRIEQGSRKVIAQVLASHETLLNLMYQFFRDGDVSQEPQLSDPV